MKKKGMIAVGAAAVVGIAGISFGKKIKTLYQSLNSFKDKNLAHTFQQYPGDSADEENQQGRARLLFCKGR